MKHRLTLLVILLFVGFVSKAQLPQLTEKSKIVMFTCGPGDELYAGFGHSALWVSDPTLGIDRLYNYGTFDFNTPNFYWKFTRGRLDYMLTVTTARRFINEYNYRKIEVHGQTLNLTLDEKQKLFDLIEENLKPENRFYKYDFFYDNCATRIRDIVVEAVDGEVDFNTEDKHLSFRQMLFPYLEHSPWTKMGINIILGLSADKIATPWEYMYLPEKMMDEFAVATINRHGNIEKLVQTETKFLDSKLSFTYNPLSDPSVLFGVLFLIIAVITFFEMRTGKYQKWLDVTLNSIGALAGLFLFFMWVGTDHSATNQNLNILWLLPAQALFLYSLGKPMMKRKKLVMISFGIIVFITVIMYFWPQETELSFLILALIFALRYLFHSRIVEKRA